MTRNESVQIDMNEVRAEKFNRQLDKMSKPLQDKCLQVREHLNDQNKSEGLKKYAIGRIAVEVIKDPDQYGTQAIKQLAMALGLGKSVLYNYKMVTEVFSRDDVEELLNTPNAVSGVTMSYSHVLCIAFVKDHEQRLHYIEQWKMHGWSVNELKKAMNGTVSPSDEMDSEADTDTDAESESVTDTARMRTPVQRTLSQINMQLTTFKTWDEVLYKPLDKVDDYDPQRVQDDLNSLLEQLEVVRQECEGHRTRIAAVIEKYASMSQDEAISLEEFIHG